MGKDTKLIPNNRIIPRKETKINVFDTLFVADDALLISAKEVDFLIILLFFCLKSIVFANFSLSLQRLGEKSRATDALAFISH